jgi:hypothetical protein
VQVDATGFIRELALSSWQLEVYEVYGLGRPYNASRQTQSQSEGLGSREAEGAALGQKSEA